MADVITEDSSSNTADVLSSDEAVALASALTQKKEGSTQSIPDIHSGDQCDVNMETSSITKEEGCVDKEAVSTFDVDVARQEESAQGDNQTRTLVSDTKDQEGTEMIKTELADTQTQGACASGEGDKESDDSEDEPDGEAMESDPYFYTKLDEFTSEIYKIELQNLPHSRKIGYKVIPVLCRRFHVTSLPPCWRTLTKIPH